MFGHFHDVPNVHARLLPPCILHGLDVHRLCLELVFCPFVMKTLVDLLLVCVRFRRRGATVGVVVALVDVEVLRGRGGCRLRLDSKSCRDSCVWLEVKRPSRVVLSSLLFGPLRFSHCVVDPESGTSRVRPLFVARLVPV